MKIPLHTAAAILNAGGVVAVPTETVYGLAASIKFPKAVRQIFKIKGRPADNPLIVHVANLVQLKTLVKSVPKNITKIKKFWPGPLTVVLIADKKRMPKVIRAGLGTVAIRWPKHKLMQALIKKTGPLAAPSANLSGRPSPTRVRHVEHDLGADFPVLDGGACAHGVESTVIALSDAGWRVLRLGAISEESLAKSLGPAQKAVAVQNKPEAPGQKYRHYAPSTALELCRAQNKIAGFIKSRRFDAVLGFDDTKTNVNVVSLGRRGAFAENLKNLYEKLRLLDQKKYRRVLVDADFKYAGLGKTLAERLKKACVK